MTNFIKSLKWQFLLLQKNSIISISFGVTIIYGLLLYFFRDTRAIDKLLVSLVLSDPSVIGYFLIALAIYTEIKHQILSALLVTPASIHQMLITKTISMTIIGVVCCLGLVVLVKGTSFNILYFTLGAVGICLMSSLLGIIMLTFSGEFLKFVMFSIPVFLIFVNLPLLHFLGGINMGFFRYLFPIQGSLDLIDYSLSGTHVNLWYSYFSIVISIPLLYVVAYRLFVKKVVQR